MRWSNRRLALAFLLAWLGSATLAAKAEELPVTGQPAPELAAFDRVMLGFLHDHNVPGAALAIARHGRIVYARGFGYADREKKTPVEPGALFRIASVSKPITSSAILRLAQDGKLKLDDPAFRSIGLEPFLAPGEKVDPRLWTVTIDELLHHSGGFDRSKSFDPMFRSIRIAEALGVKPPAGPREIVRYMMGRSLDFEPGEKEVYSNFGYCVLGRVIEKASGKSYEAYVKESVLHPLGIERMRIGHSLESERAPGEATYYARPPREANSVFDPGSKVPVQYGGWDIEAMDAHGGWIASAPELVRFACALDDPAHNPVLGAAAIAKLFARPKITGYDDAGKPRAVYYGCGWEVRRVGADHMNTWHTGLLDGSSSLLVRRYDGLTWAVLFNADYDEKGKYLAGEIDPLLHPVADSITHWPAGAARTEWRDR